MLTEEQTQFAFRDSVIRYGLEHTHDLSCRTWRGQNWFGACDCTLPERLDADR